MGEAKESSLSTITLENLDEIMFPDGGPYPSKIIEISGKTNTGKSLLLMELMAKTILPKAYDGKCLSVVFYNLDQKFSFLQFLKICEKIVISSDKDMTVEEIREILENSLKRLHIFNCYSAKEFDFSMACIDCFLYNSKDVGLLAIDSINAFYWFEHNEKNIRMDTHYKNKITQLKNICSEYKVVGVYVQDQYYASKQTDNCKLYDYKFELKDLPDNDELKGKKIECDIDGMIIKRLMGISDNGVYIV